MLLVSTICLNLCPREHQLTAIGHYYDSRSALRSLSGVTAAATLSAAFMGSVSYVFMPLRPCANAYLSPQ